MRTVDTVFNDAVSKDKSGRTNKHVDFIFEFLQQTVHNIDATKYCNATNISSINDVNVSCIKLTRLCAVMQ